MPDKAERMLRELAVFKNIRKDELVAIKLHFGERGNTGFVRPIYIRRIVEAIREAGGKPFLTDANTLYRGERSNAVDHLNIAVQNGFSYACVNAPILIADGLNGKDYVEVETGGKYFDKVKVASAAHHADSLISVAHVKGHMLFGFGGAVKNVGMGLGARSGKQMMHADLVPKIVSKKCVGCGLCVEWCPTGSLTLKDHKGRELPLSTLEQKTCTGCGECVVTCPHDAVKISWSGAPQSVLTDITPDCDCAPRSDAAIVADIGILASDDLVAIDRASIDLINRQPSIRGTAIPDDKLDEADKFGVLHGVDWTHQFAYSERIGLGSSKYDIREI
jgi:uncharacterized Fe-S center protein